MQTSGSLIPAIPDGSLHSEKWVDDYGGPIVASIDECKPLVKERTEQEYGYGLSKTLDEIRPGYRFNESRQETVPPAITAFRESKDFEDAIRNAISLDGDSDTILALRTRPEYPR